MIRSLLLAGASTLLLTSAASAADLGGNCCADLEERIAELEATTARKSNRKVTLQIYGQVNAGLLYVDINGYSDTKVINNGNDESFVGFAGRASISPDIKAGYVIEFDLHQLGLLDTGASSFEPRVRQSYVYLSSDTLGSIGIGRQAQATQDFDKITTANTSVAAKPLSLGAVSDYYLTGVDVPFDGHYRDVVRYQTPTLQGFSLSASWGPSKDAKASDGNGNTWDVALRYSGEFSGFKLAGGAGFRRDTDLDINVLNVINLSVPTGDVNTILAVGSVMHTGTGIFVTGNYADQDWKDLNFRLKAWQVTAGVEQKWFSIGKTTLFGEYGRLTVDPTSGSSLDVDLYGLGLVQNLENAGMDLYLAGRQYDLPVLTDNVKVITAGARIRF